MTSSARGPTSGCGSAAVRVEREAERCGEPAVVEHCADDVRCQRPEKSWHTALEQLDDGVHMMLPLTEPRRFFGIGTGDPRWFRLARSAVKRREAALSSATG